MNPEQQPHDIASVIEPRVDAAKDDEIRERNRTVAQMSAVGIGGNVLLAVFKLVAGIIGNSMALVSDAVHSTSDVLATAVAYVGDRISRREADENHPYGHERFEQLASAVLALILASVGIGIGVAGVQTALDIVSADGAAVGEAPGVLALVAATDYWRTKALYADWYKALSEEGNGVWVGSGFCDQTALSYARALPAYRAPAQRSDGFVAVGANVVPVRLVEPEVQEEVRFT